ncbi:MAG TPA: tRNA (adenosine(37)-N6)-dimethylallyltransferase MiaA [Actinomycetota bacterium]
MTAEPRTLAIVGPTATGKSAVALGIAADFRAEIVCVDSMTVYRGVDVGTAKPTAADRARVRHHLLDLAEPNETFTVARFQAEARTAIEGIAARGSTPLLAGGSGLYFRAVVDELRFPPADAAVRAGLQARPLAELRALLVRRDRVAAAAIEAGNARRIVRALEVIELTGRPFSSFRDEWERHAPGVLVAGLDLPAEPLRERIRARLEGMLEAGLLDEVRVLVERGFREALTASQAAGYREALALIDGRIDRAGFLEAATRSTVRLAKRQRRWFAADPRVRWFDATELERAGEEVRAYLRGSLVGSGRA